MAVLRNRYPLNIPPAGADPLLKYIYTCIHRAVSMIRIHAVFSTGAARNVIAITVSFTTRRMADLGPVSGPRVPVRQYLYCILE